MNTDTITNPDPGLAEPESTFDPLTPSEPQHRKVARLPKPLRDMVNTMLDEGLSARQIVANLQACSDPPLPYPISGKNIADWRNTGYRRYLAQQERLALFQSNREGAGDLVAADDITTLPEATLQIVANQYYELMADFSPETLKEKLSEDPLKYTRFLNVFARLVREIVHLRKFRDASTKAAAAAKLKELDPDRDLNEPELDLLVNRMDRVFKIARSQNAAPHSNASSGEKDSTPGHPQSKIAIQNSKSIIESQPQQPLQAPPPAHRNSEMINPASDPAVSKNGQGEPARPCEQAGEPNSLATNHNAEAEISPEFCPQCNRLLPPLLSTGERPNHWCNQCGAPLPPPQAPSTQNEKCSILNAR